MAKLEINASVCSTCIFKITLLYSSKIELNQLESAQNGSQKLVQHTTKKYLLRREWFEIEIE